MTASESENATAAPDDVRITRNFFLKALRDMLTGKKLSELLYMLIVKRAHASSC